MNMIRDHLNQTWQRPTRAWVFAAVVIMSIMNPLGRPTASAQEACCFPDGTCTDVPPADCTAAGGLARGAGTTCATVICPPAHDCSTPSVAIPDNDATGIDDTIHVADMGTIADVNVYVRVDHTWVGHLIMTLEHVDSGTTVVIYDQPFQPPAVGGCSGDDLDIILDDQAMSSIETSCAAGTPTQFGSFMPNNPLAAFKGEDTAGMWTLNISDNVSGNTGTLNEWCLIFDTDGDGVADAADVCPNDYDPLQFDSDGDGAGDECDECPNDAAKLNPGACGCGTADDDHDVDGVPDCFDGCPNDPNKLQPGLCGCGNVDVLNSPCASTPAGQSTGTCGCDGGTSGMMVMPMTLVGIGWMRRRRRNRHRM